MDKELNDVFDVLKCSFDDTEIYELISPYILFKINKDNNTYK